MINRCNGVIIGGDGSTHVETMYDHVGGEPAIRAFVTDFLGSVHRDPILQPLFGAGRDTHVEHLTAVFVEVMGGPTRYTDEMGGFPHLLEAHRGLRITEPQRQRFVDLMLAAADSAGLPGDEKFRGSLRGYVEFGSEVAAHNSNITSDADLHPCQEIPKWSWQGS